MPTISKNTITYSSPPDPRSSLQKERAASKFDPVQMLYFIEGSKERAEETKYFLSQFERDPVLAMTPKVYGFSKEQQREDTANRIARLSKYIEYEEPEVFLRRLSILGLIDPQTTTRLSINLGLFLMCIRGNGTADQLKFWFHEKGTSKIRTIYGCFGMTEFAHGSNVAALETTATFDKETDEFIINTPHIGATKWWIGGAAHSATHCSVYARMIVDGKDYGVKTFVVPLRDSSFDLYPGVTVGDIGAKMGRDGVDNGWIQFSQVRIPRYFMLQKFCKVTREGEVTLPPLEQLAYSALLGGRVIMVADSYRISAKFVTIALRYAIGRRQFKSKLQKDGETQLLNYPLHQKRLFPYLAFAYCCSQASWKLARTIDSILNSLDKAVADDDMNTIMKSIEDLKALFIDTACMKSTCTWIAADAIDQCRQACGGHGYSAYNGFGKAYSDWVVQCTWEGDNNVLGMSSGKPLIRTFNGVKEGKKAEGSISFFNNATEYLTDKFVLESIKEIDDTKKVVKAIEVLIVRLTAQAAKTAEAHDGIVDFAASDSVILSKLKAHHFILDVFLSEVENFENKELVPYLRLLGKVYAATLVLDKFSGEFLTYSVLPKSLFTELNSSYIPALLEEVRPNVVALTDSFQLNDMALNSAIGKYNGDIYENYFDIVKAQNPSDPNCRAPYSESFEAFLNRPSLPVRQRHERSKEVADKLSK